MQKKIIALAVAGLVSGAAFAQSNVTVYGVVDVYGNHATADNAAGDQKYNGIDAGGLSGSRIGFKGQEDLGNGLKAIFTLEYGSLDVTKSSGITSTRQSFVGLTSKTLGTLTAGRLQGIGYNFGVKYDAMGVSAFSPVYKFTKGTKVGINGGARIENAVSYVSPSFSGFSAMAEYAFSGEAVTGDSTAVALKAAVPGNAGTAAQAATNDSATQYGLGVQYANGPLAVGLAYLNYSDIGNTLVNVNEATRKEWALGATYDFKVVALAASYQQAKNDSGTVEYKGKIWNVGATIPVFKAGNIHVAYARYSDDQAANVKANSWGVDYQHSLSKRTTAYVGYNTVNNGDNAKFASGSAVPSLDRDSSVFGFGVRHSF